MTEEPSLEFGPLRIWIHGRRFPEARDFWDGNRLAVTARCEGVGSNVTVSGAFLHLDELRQWRDAVERLHRALEGEANLLTTEPVLKVQFATAGKVGTGHFTVEIEITGDHLGESHRFQFGADQSYLPGLISQLSAILQAYPLRRDVAPERDA